MEPYARGIPGADTLLADLILVPCRVGGEWDERTRKDLFSGPYKLSRAQPDARLHASRGPSELFERFKSPPKSR